MGGTALALGAASSPSWAAVEAPPVAEFRRGGMVYRRLGQTDMYPSLLSFGSHTDHAYWIKTSWGTMLSEEGQKRRDRHILHGLDLGVNLFDLYEHEGQWEPVKRVLGSNRSRVLLSACRDFNEYVGDSIDRACRLFGHVDLYRLHGSDFENIDGRMLADWDVLRRAKEAGKVRALGISVHNEEILMQALAQLEGIDYVFFPYNFIYARADFSRFIPAARAQGVGLIAMKPVALGSIVNLDPRARKGGPRPENEQWTNIGSQSNVIAPAVVAAMTKVLNRLPDESLCQAAIRFVYAKKFLTCTLAGMWDDQWIDENYAALTRYEEMGREETAALEMAAKVARRIGPAFLPPDYRWLGARWGV
jgi:aryl-alcohol dehydrogenase-like predicted oxidoreductase